MRRGSPIAAAIVALLFGASNASAKTFEVTRHNDPAPGKCKPNDCSLREAIRAANKRNGGDRVVLPDRGRYVLKQENEILFQDEDLALGGDLDVTDRLTLVHPGRGRATVDANQVDRVLEVIAPTRVTKLKVTGGGNVSQAVRAESAPRTSTTGDGGGIESNAPLTLKRSVVAGNVAAAAGGIRVFVESSGPDSAPLRLIGSRVANNRTLEGPAGGISANGSAIVVKRSSITGNRSANNSGGLTIFNGRLRMTDSTVASNRARYDSAGIYLLGLGSQVRAVIRGSTISENVALDVSGFPGTGIGLENAELVITNSTVAGNRSPGAVGGAGIATNAVPGSEVTMNSVTVVRNRVATGSGGGLLNESKAGTWNVVNSLIALNMVGGAVDDCAGTFASGGGNLLTSIPFDCEGFDTDVSGDFLRPTPKLGSLKRNGGPTRTVALKRGSPAIGKAIKSEAPKRDQRGVKRTDPDIGAYER